jgi:hypothetical protein
MINWLSRASDAEILVKLQAKYDSSVEKNSPRETWALWRRIMEVEERMEARGDEVPSVAQRRMMRPEVAA